MTSAFSGAPFFRMSSQLISSASPTSRSCADPYVSRITIDVLFRVVSTAALRGRPVLLEFFAEHCKPCLTTLPQLGELARARPELVIIGISEDEDEATARRLQSQLSLQFAIVHDRGHVLAGRYRVSELPATFAIDTLGAVRWRGERAHDAGELERVIEALR